MAKWGQPAVFLTLLLGTGLLDFHAVASASQVKVSQVRASGQRTNDSRNDVVNTKHNSKRKAKKKVRFTVRLELPSSKVEQLLSNQDEKQYDQLSKILADDIQKLYADTPGEQKVYNLQFSSKQDRNGTRGRARSDNVSRHDQSEQQHPEVRRRKGSKSTFAPTASPHSAAMTSATTPVPPFWSATTSGALPLSPTSRKGKRKKKYKKGRQPTAKPLAELTNRPTQEAVTTIGVRELTTTTISDGKFNILRLTKKFKDCFGPSDSRGEYIILMEPYIDAYSELLGIFDMFGAIFSFAGDDIRNKLTSLRALRGEDLKAQRSHYASLQSMFEYEHSPEGAAADLEGVRENRWLHRAMKFISAIIKAIRDENRDTSLASKARAAYDDVLAPHHEWYVRMSVHIALISFPSRDAILAKMEVSDDPSGMQAIDDLSSVVDAVYEDILKLSKKYSLPAK
ncbi:unnamed protein product [Lymnaea stagnalis]|uniref:Glycolipid transfer protein domain-containing protein n=1 Tax=Lymnaea stagnalis TaxID=6523 RepID=A0AAV2HBX3_LYMST